MTVIDSGLLRRAMSSFATGVTVVTVGGRRPHGMTANSFASVSLDPPLVLVCVGREAIMHGSMSASVHFGVSVLAAEQTGVARHFANRWRPMGSAEFEAVPYRAGRVTGVPMIRDALAGFECELWRGYDGGDHTIFVGKVLSLDHRTDGDGLLFFRGRYHLAGPVPSGLTA